MKTQSSKSVAPTVAPVVAPEDVAAPATNIVRPTLKASPLSTGVLNTDSRSILNTEPAGRHMASLVIAFAYALFEMARRAPRTFTRMADQVAFIRDGEGKVLNRSQTVQGRLRQMGFKISDYASRGNASMICGHADSVLKNTLGIADQEHLLGDLLTVAEQDGQDQPSEEGDNIPF